MKSVGILSYGVGNIKSAYRAFQKIGAKVNYVSYPAEIRKLDLLVLPGVGSFSHCKKKLVNQGLWTAVYEHISENKPFSFRKDKFGKNFAGS